MMYGFGDDQNPYTESVDFLEDLVIVFITDMTHRAMEIGRTGRVQVEDIVFLGNFICGHIYFNFIVRSSQKLLHYFFLMCCFLDIQSEKRSQKICQSKGPSNNERRTQEGEKSF